jgi:hypothetical protein
MSERSRNLLSAGLFIACGIGSMVGVLLHPERINGPTWLGHAASGAFVLTGLAIVCQSFGLNKAFDWLILAMLVSLFAVGAWVAFGPGARMCEVSLPIVNTSRGGLVCRSAFGLGATLVGAMAVWQFIRILKGRSAA